MKKEAAADIRRLSADIRSDVIEMIYACGAGNPGSALSSVEIMLVLYEKILGIDSSNFATSKRNRFVLSKGHACPVLYSYFVRKGYIKDQDILGFRRKGSIFQTHPDIRFTPGIDFTTGSLGTGLSVAQGMAMAEKYHGSGHKVYVLCGDGELQEGQNWEAVISAAHFKLDNLFLIVDHNGLQQDNTVENTLRIAPLTPKFESFGWNAVEIDGHDTALLEDTFRKIDEKDGRPKVIIARTVKGKGVSFMEGSVRWHLGAGLTGEQKEQALKDIRDGI